MKITMTIETKGKNIPGYLDKNTEYQLVSIIQDPFTLTGVSIIIKSKKDDGYPRVFDSSFFDLNSILTDE